SAVSLVGHRVAYGTGADRARARRAHARALAIRLARRVRVGATLDAVVLARSRRARGVVDAGARLPRPRAAAAAEHQQVPREIDVGIERHARSEEHTSELQSLAYLVCRLL